MPSDVSRNTLIVLADICVGMAVTNEVCRSHCDLWRHDHIPVLLCCLHIIGNAEVSEQRARSISSYYYSIRFVLDH